MFLVMTNGTYLQISYHMCKSVVWNMHRKHLITNIAILFMNCKYVPAYEIGC